jgi:hypothetical protein
MVTIPSILGESRFQYSHPLLISLSGRLLFLTLHREQDHLLVHRPLPICLNLINLWQKLLSYQGKLWKMAFYDETT